MFMRSKNKYKQFLADYLKGVKMTNKKKK